MKLSLRTRLIGGFLLVIVTSSAITTIVGIHMMGKGVVNQMHIQNEVRHDLASAREIYEEELANIRNAVRYTAVRFFVKEALASGNATATAEELRLVRQREGLDVLTLTDANGTVLLRARDPAAAAGGPAASPIVRRALAAKTVIASTEIVPQGELAKEGEDLAARAHTALIRTPKAKPSDRKFEVSGLVLLAAAPVVGEDGELLGGLYGGTLLNGRTRIVDKIKATVYEGERYAGRDIGAATIFQGDVRISTNVEMPDGERAVGTRVSAEVYERVLTQAEPWLERAFVVNDWYITAYESIRNASGEVIGILGVGMYEGKFAQMRRSALLAFAGVSLGAITLSIAICYLLARKLTRPVHDLVLAARRLAEGDLHQRVEPDPATEEIGAFGKAFNVMAASIEERDQQLQQRAEEQILKSEKLAMIGRLAAGVAHEINNPLGSILLFSRLLLRKAPTEGVQRENLERIAKEADRCKSIVQGLLEFARQREPKTENVDLNEVARKPISLLENQAVFHNIEIVEDFQEDLPLVPADASQLQQVFLNVLVNAAEAIEGKGTVTITTRAVPGADRAEIRFTDTGCGIPQENLQRLFEPFFTTKDVGNGTGLGLSISYGVLQRHGGNIEVHSRVNEGSTFIVSLPTTSAAAAVHAGSKGT